MRNPQGVHAPLLRTLFLALVTLAALVASLKPAIAADGRITGTVTSDKGEVVPDAEVVLVELKRSVHADASGAFAFEGVPVGRWLVEAESPRDGTAVSTVDVVEGQAATLALRVELAVHREHVVVSAGVAPQSLSGLAQPVAILDDRDLAAAASPTIGETLAAQPGVSETQYAPGASRPVIRGLGGDRIRLLQNGIGAGDASNVSQDHAVSVDPSVADSIEVVRGAATLLYGSNAIGGVVNIIDSRIPDHRGDPIGGTATLRYGSSNDLESGSLKLDGTAGWFGWHADYANTDSGNQSVGGGSGFPGDEIPNSDLESENKAVGASWLGETAFLGVAYNDFTTNYGSAVESEVRIEMKQKRWDLQGGINAPFGPFRFLKARIGTTDYEHVELEAGAIGTRFLNDSVEGRVELAHNQAGPWLGSFGAQASTRSFEAIGEEAFVQPTDTRSEALFAFEELGTGAVKGQFGARYEDASVTSSDPTLRDRDFGAPSGAAGLVWKPAEEWSIGTTLSYSSRVPTAEELYANGPHIATASFEIGDDDLSIEKALGLDVSLRRLTGRISGEIDVFYTDFTDFIYESDTGTTFTTVDGDELAIIQFSQSAAEFYGAEAHLDFELLHVHPHHLELELRGDYVHAELTDLGEPVPLIPPLRGALAIRYQGRALWASVEAARSQKQDRFAANDVETPGYTTYGAEVGYRLVAGRVVNDFIVRGSNLTDELAFNSVSRFRFAVPLPGRDIRATYRIGF
jgi:iron complex outermembrane receptor protein